MKTFTYKQAIQVLTTYFKGFQIIKAWDTLKELDIIFKDANGKQWELISTSDNYFQTVEDYVILEA